jgi:hypothetical protein
MPSKKRDYNEDQTMFPAKRLRAGDLRINVGRDRLESSKKWHEDCATDSFRKP